MEGINMGEFVFCNRCRKEIPKYEEYYIDNEP